MTPATLYMVIPCYNEEEVLPITSKELLRVYNDLRAKNLINEKSRILFVNDGSKDKTWEIIGKLHEENPVFGGVCLSRNKGHQNALLAGLMTAKKYADCVVSLDADLQDDVGAIEKMVLEYHNGNDIVYGVRSARDTDTAFKRMTAEGFYKVMKALGADVVFNHADYRLMSKRALDGLEEFEEVNLFLRGIVPLIGYKSTTVEYERGERAAGESKYPLKKMLSFAMDGITSFSVKPMRIITSLGVLIFIISIIMVLWAFITKLVGATVPGWSSILISVWALGGLQLLCLGVVGEYIGKIYSETKHRPRYIISQTLIDE